MFWWQISKERWSATACNHQQTTLPCDWAAGSGSHFFVPARHARACCSSQAAALPSAAVTSAAPPHPSASDWDPPTLLPCFHPAAPNTPRSTFRIPFHIPRLTAGSATNERTQQEHCHVEINIFHPSLKIVNNDFPIFCTWPATDVPYNLWKFRENRKTGFWNISPNMYYSYTGIRYYGRGQINHTESKKENYNGY